MSTSGGNNFNYFSENQRTNFVQFKQYINMNGYILHGKPASLKLTGAELAFLESV